MQALRNLIAKAKAWLVAHAIDDWRSAYKYVSTQMLGLIGAIQGLLAVFPVAAQGHIPFTHSTWADVGNTLSIIAAVVGVVGRYLDASKGK